MKRKLTVIVLLAVITLFAGPVPASASFGNAYGNEPSPYVPKNSFAHLSVPPLTPPAIHTPTLAPRAFSDRPQGEPESSGVPAVISGLLSGGAASDNAADAADAGNTSRTGNTAPSTTTLAVANVAGSTPLLVMPVSITLDSDEPRNANNSPQPDVTVGANGMGGTGALGGAGGDTAGTSAAAQGGGHVIGNLVETYDVLLGMYEHTFEAGRSFLASVPNGGRTRDGVWLEFPRNMKLSMELDGKSVTPKTKMWLTDTGSYTIVATSPKIVGTGESVGVFTFRILPAHAAGKEETGTDGKTRPAVQEFFSASSNGGQTLIEYVFSNYKRFYANVADGETVGAGVYFVVPPNVSCSVQRNGAAVTFQNNRIYDEPGNYVVTVSAPSMETTGTRAIALYSVLSFTIDTGTTVASTSDIQNGNATEPETEAASEGLPVTEELTQVPDGTNYRQYFSNGASFLGSVANEGVSQVPVWFEIPDKMRCELLLDGRVIRYDSGNEITEPGSYVLHVYYSSDDERESARRASLRFTIEEQPVGQPQEGAQGEKDQQTHAPALEAKLPEQSYTGEAFRHSISSNLYFTSNIPNGITSRVAAEFSIPESAARRLLLNGEEIAFAGDETLSTPGNYQLLVTDPVSQEEFLFRFAILPPFVKELGPLLPPTDYRINTALKNGEPYPFQPTGVVVDTDGDYVIQMTADGDYPPFTVDFTLDTVAPTLTLIGVEDGRATGAEVTLQSDDPNASVRVRLNGESIDYTGGALTKSGDYIVTVTDQAGNYTSYEFSVPFKLNKTALLFLVLVVLLLGAGVFYFLRLRKTVKL